MIPDSNWVNPEIESNKGEGSLLNERCDISKNSHVDPDFLQEQGSPSEGSRGRSSSSEGITGEGNL